MTTYYKTSSNGEITQATTFPEIAKKLGFTQQIDKEIIYGFDGKLYISGQEPVPPEATYIQKRALAYPTMPEQLDMIYWDKTNGTNNWQSLISEIKARYPKK